MQNKYNAKKYIVDNISFDSGMEAAYYSEVVKPGYESGEIVKYELQKPYELQEGFTHEGSYIRPIVYVADFYIEYKDGSSVVVDIKGFADAQAKLKRKMFWHKYPEIRYIWMVRSLIDGGWCDYEYVKKKRAERKRTKQNK